MGPIPVRADDGSAAAVAADKPRSAPHPGSTRSGSDCCSRWCLQHPETRQDRRALPHSTCRLSRYCVKFLLRLYWWFREKRPWHAATESRTMVVALL